MAAERTADCVTSIPSSPVCLIRSKKRKRSEDGGSNRESFSGGGGGVTKSIKGIRPFPNLWGQFSHFCDTSSVVSNRSESIRGKRDSEGGKHTDGGDTDTIRASKFFAGQNGDDENDNRDDG